MVSQAGTLTYRARSDGSPYSVINQAHGTYTELPAARPGDRAGSRPLPGGRSPGGVAAWLDPAYRTLSAGATGPDVAELNADLVALGYATQLSCTRSAVFGSATPRRREEAPGRPGRKPGRRPDSRPGGVRTHRRAGDDPGSTPLGGHTQPGQPVLQATSTVRLVQIALAASQQSEVKVGTRSVTLPDNRTTPALSPRWGTSPPVLDLGGGGSNSSSSAPRGTDSCSSVGKGSSTPTVTVEVQFSDAAATGRLDQAPVQVEMTTGVVRGALDRPSDGAGRAVRRRLRG